MRKRMIASLLLALLAVYPAAEAAASTSSAGNALGLSLLRAGYEADGKALISPYSLAVALSMAAAGAVGDTRAQLLDLLGADAPTPPAAIPGLVSANAAMVSDWITPTDAYLRTLDGYRAEVFTMAQDVMAQVNDWAREHTSGLIDPLLTQQPDPLLRMVLLNAVSFDAKWQNPFLTSDTGTLIFHGASGDLEAPCLRRNGSTYYRAFDGIQAVKLPYADSTVACYVLLPEAGGMMAALDGLCADPEAAFDGYERAMVDLRLPKLDLTGGGNLGVRLQMLGATLPFSRSADFSGMTGDTSLTIGDVTQRVRLCIDEDGTKAGAATAAFMVAKSAFATIPPIDMIVDRPFILLIRDDEVGAILFAACVTSLDGSPLLVGKSAP